MIENKVNKKIYHLIIEILDGEVKTKTQIRGSSKEVMVAIKTFKDKYLRFKVNELLNSKEIKIEYKNNLNNKIYKIRKIEYKRIKQIDPDRENKRGENIEEKRGKMIQNSIIQTESKKEIVDIADKLIKYLYISKDFKDELKELEIKRIQSDSLYRDYIYYGENLKIIESNSSILYQRKIDENGSIEVLLQNSKIESIEIIYKGIGNFKMFEFGLLFSGRVIDDIDKEIKNPKAKVEDFREFSRKIKDRYN